MSDIKKGDWVIHNFQMKQVQEVSDNWYELSDGIIMTSTSYPGVLATTKSKCIANDVRHYYDLLYNEFSCIIRNWPDLNRLFDKYCTEMIDVMNDDEKLDNKYKELRILYDDINTLCKQISNKEIAGIKLFSR